MGQNACPGQRPRYTAPVCRETIMTTEAPETITVEDTIIACDGGGGALGHPRVYLNMADKGRVECGYCDRLFILDPKAKPKSHH